MGAGGERGIRKEEIELIASYSKRREEDKMAPDF